MNSIPLAAAKGGRGMQGCDACGEVGGAGDLSWGWLDWMDRQSLGMQGDARKWGLGTSISDDGFGKRRIEASSNVVADRARARVEPMDGVARRERGPRVHMGPENPTP